MQQAGDLQASSFLLHLNWHASWPAVMHYNAQVRLPFISENNWRRKLLPCWIGCRSAGGLAGWLSSVSAQNFLGQARGHPG